MCLINARIQALGISRSELATLCGFRNIAKAVRRLDEVSAGDFSHADFLLSNLPNALSIAPHVVEAAVLATEQAKLREEDRRYRDAFRPHGIIVCERSIPEPIWLAAVLGVDRILRIDFAESSMPVTYVRRAIEGLKDKQRRWGSTAVPGFGQATGFVINYSLDRAVKFDLDERPLCAFDKAVQMGMTSASMLGRRINGGDLKLLLGC